MLEEHYIYRKIKAAKKPNSSVPGDLPKQVVKEFAVELSLPVTVIFNAITRTAEYPRQWVVEYQTPIPKLYPPLSVDDLRNISGTTFFSKLYESCLSDWLMPIVLPYLDPANCGGLKGTSISHYLIRLLHFIHSAADKPQPHAVLLALVDLSKAFNRVDHSLVIEDLHDMHVPAWLLKILISYLTERSMFMKFQGSLSSKRSLPGSSPQGVFLGCFLFMIKFNGALLRPGIPRPIPRPSPIMLSSAKSCTVKYIDDASHACIINLKKDLDRDSAGTGHVLNPVHNTLQEDLDQLKHFTDTNLMIINEKKTNILAFNFSKSIDFTPELRIGDSPYLDVVKDTKLLGIIISDNLKWDLHVEYMCKRAAKKIWMLRRMRLLHIEPHIILDYYLKEIRSILEFGVAVWNSGLTAKLSHQVERIQKICVSIMLCDTNWQIPYEVGCTLLGIEPLYLRREELCVRFIQKASKNPMHADMFYNNKNHNHNTRPDPEHDSLLYREYLCNNKRFYNSPLCYLTRLLNRNPVKVS